jgi:hypothetical protein
LDCLARLWERPQRSREATQSRPDKFACADLLPKVGRKPGRHRNLSKSYFAQQKTINSCRFRRRTPYLLLMWS